MNARPRPDDQMEALSAEGFPAFITADQDAKRHIGPVRELFGDLELVLLDGDDVIVAAGWAVPITWNGQPADLPAGYPDSLARALASHQRGDPADTLVIMAAQVHPGRRGRGLAGELLTALRAWPPSEDSWPVMRRALAVSVTLLLRAPGRAVMRIRPAARPRFVMPVPPRTAVRLGGTMPSSDAHATMPGPGAHSISFRPVTRDDFSLLHRWLVTPEVQAWWRTQARTLQDVERDYGPQVAGEDPTLSFLIRSGDTPVGMIQCYRHADYPEWEAAVGIPSAVGIDYLIGEARNRGQGIGSASIAAFTPVVFGTYPDADVIVSVPLKDNRASCRALEKAGFTLVSERELNTGDPSDAGVSAIYSLARRERPAHT